jgi:hypothetical protein
LKSQAQELVQTVEVFKLDENTSPPKIAVRSSKPARAAFTGDERSVVSAKPKSHAVAIKPIDKPLVASMPLLVAKVTPKGGDDEWEAF